jgi:hypothetical protein
MGKRLKSDPMDYKRAERYFRELQSQRDRGELDDAAFRVEVAKLLFRDEQGIFWMLNADDGTWFCNRGEHWEVGDPSAEPAAVAAQAARRKVRRRLGWGLALGIALIILTVVGGVLVLRQRLSMGQAVLQPTATASIGVQVTIASPLDGSQVVLGQEVAVEFTVKAMPDLQIVDHVELRVNGQTVETRQMRAKAQPGQSSLPLSQSWRPPAVGEYEVAVVALSGEGALLGEASVTLNVAEASGEALSEPACTPDASFVADVTIPPGTVSPPGARMDKVWQVRNDGSCAWGVGYELVPVGGDELGDAQAMPVPPTAAGIPADLTVTFQAPDEAGIYTQTWQLQSPDGERFGPTLTLRIEIEVLAEESEPPAAPTEVQAEVVDDGNAVRLTWQDRSDNEDAFRIHREDVEASIGLAPANATLFVDEAVTCGNTYRYGVVAFNEAGPSSLAEAAEVTLPRCAPADAPPSLVLTVVPTHVLASETFTVVIQADDDLGVTQILVWGEETGHPALDTGRVFTCTEVTCARSWPLTWTETVSTTLSLVAIASDSSGQESEPARFLLDIFPPE